jgi:hypothetical protein
MKIEKRYAQILQSQAEDKSHNELIQCLTNKEEYCEEFLIFVKMELLARVNCEYTVLPLYINMN